MFTLRHAIITPLLFGLVMPLQAAPQITNLSIRGLQVGGTTTLTIQGSDLLPAPKLIATFPIAKQTVLDKAAANNVQFEVTLAADVTPGMYNLRLANDKGVSDSVIVAVDRLPQAGMKETIEATPIALHGQLTGSQIIRTSLTGKAGQQFLAEVESQRLGGKLRPVLRLFGSHRNQIALAMPAPWLGGDTRLTVELPADGEFTLELNDLQYAGPSPGHFRLKVGAFQYADMVFPPAVMQGKKTSLVMIGNVPSDKSVEVTPTVHQPMAAPWPELPMPSGCRPRVFVSDILEVVESPCQETNEAQSLPEIPVGVSGRLDEPGQEDVYRVNVEEGSKLRFEVFADRLGAPMDAFLDIRNEKGTSLAKNDDIAGTTDAGVDYAVAKGVKTIDVAIRDQVLRGEQRSIYRLLITRLDGDQPKKPSFLLEVNEDTHNVRQDASKVFQIVSQRHGYDGPIRLEFENLPDGVTASAGEIAAGSNGALVTLTAAAGQVNSVITSIRGTSVGADPAITATAVFDKHPLGTLQPWMQDEIALALAPPNEKSLKIDWSKPQDETPLALGSTIAAPVKLVRPPRGIGPIRLSLVSGDPPPLVNGKPDPNRSVRAEKATIDIAVDPKAKAALDALTSAEKAVSDAMAKAKTTQDATEEAAADADKAVKDAESERDAALKAFLDAESKINSDATFNVIVPPNSEVSVCDLALKAELRSVDNKTVLAEVYTPVRRFVPLNPLEIKLSGESRFEAKLDAKTGASVKLTGKIQRKAGFAGDVTVSITGQPGGVAVPKTVVKPDKDSFELELKFPANFKPAEVTSIKLFATGPHDPKKANIVVRTEIPLTINILAADPAK